jgi:hypothetical protein
MNNLGRGGRVEVVRLVAGSSPSSGQDACSVAGGETWPSLDVFTLLLQPTGASPTGLTRSEMPKG